MSKNNAPHLRMPECEVGSYSDHYHLHQRIPSFSVSATSTAAASTSAAQRPNDQTQQEQHVQSGRDSLRNTSSASVCSLREQQQKKAGVISPPLPLHRRHDSSLSVTREKEASPPTAFDHIDLQQPRPAALKLQSTKTHYDPHELHAPSPLEQVETKAARQLGTFTGRGHQRSLTDTFFDNCRPFVERAATTLQSQTTSPSKWSSVSSPKKSFADFISAHGFNTSNTQNTHPVEERRASPKSQPSSPLKGRTRAEEEEAELRFGQPLSPLQKRTSKVVNDWFTGTSAPVNIGFFRQDRDDNDDSEYESYSDSEEEEGYHYRNNNKQNNNNNNNTMFNKPPTSAPSSRSSTIQSQNNPNGGKLGWLFGSKPSQPPPQDPNQPHDELLDLSIPTALQPHGPLDPLNPSSFNDLFATATALISRYQNSYRTKTYKVTELESDLDAHTDERDEARTRADHLKTQLDEMSRQLAKQERKMGELRRELDAEREARGAYEEKTSQLNSAQVQELKDNRSSACLSGSGAKLQSPPQNNWRISDAISVDSGFESDAGDNASITTVSQNRMSVGTTRSSIAPSGCGGAFESISLDDIPEPTSATSTSSVSASFPSTASSNGAAPRPKALQRSSTYNRNLVQSKQRSSKFSVAMGQSGGGQVEKGLFEENGWLKERVRELEGSVEECLELVGLMEGVSPARA